MQGDTQAARARLRRIRAPGDPAASSERRRRSDGQRSFIAGAARPVTGRRRLRRLRTRRSRRRRAVGGVVGPHRHHITKKRSGSSPPARRPENGTLVDERAREGCRDILKCQRPSGLASRRLRGLTSSTAHDVSSDGTIRSSRSGRRAERDSSGAPVAAPGAGLRLPVRAFSNSGAEAARWTDQPMAWARSAPARGRVRQVLSSPSPNSSLEARVGVTGRAAAFVTRVPRGR